jgi:hypothetical protein
MDLQRDGHNIYSTKDKDYYFHRQLLYGRDKEFQTFPRVTDFNENCRNKLHTITQYIIM